jgi:hypothetical protein
MNKTLNKAHNSANDYLIKGSVHQIKVNDEKKGGLSSNENSHCQRK